MQGTRVGSRRPSVANDAFDTQSLELGDTVEVAGGNRGIVKYIGSVQGKPGLFAGVELSRDCAAFGKNNGDVDGVQYFSCAIPGAGIFLPTHRATKIYTPQTPSSMRPPPPETSLPSLRSPPTTPLIPKFSQSVGPGARHPLSQTVGPVSRAATPQSKAKPRPSLPRPSSPSKAPAQPLGRPTVAGFRAPSSPAVSRASAKPATPIPTRTHSRSQSRLGDARGDGANTPTSMARPGAGSRTTSSTVASRPDEVRHLKQQLEDRDRQLGEQALSIAEMENALTELQSLVTANTAEGQNEGTKSVNGETGSAMTEELERLRATLAEKNDRIAALTAEHDAHRRDFRETISALESASSETERVYETKIRQLTQEVDELRASNEELARQGDFSGSREDMETVAEQLAQLEELVQELEEGLDDSRRNEAEAKRKVEELEGEAERSRLALEQEISKKNSQESKAGQLEDSALAQQLQRENAELEQELHRRDNQLKDLNATFRTLELESRDHDERNAEKAQELVSLRTSLAALSQQSAAVTAENESLVAELSEAKRDLAAARNIPTGTHQRNYSPSPTRTPLAKGATTGALRPFGRDSPHALASILNSRAVRADEDSKQIYCDLCEESGHDILNCPETTNNRHNSGIDDVDGAAAHLNDDFLSSKNLPPLDASAGKVHMTHSAPESQAAAITTNSVAPQEEGVDKVESNPDPPVVFDPHGTGPQPGKRSGRVDMEMYCAFCDGLGHESLDCPFEEEL